MDAVSEPAVHTVVWMSSSQVGKTEFLNNIVGYHIHREPAPILMLQPTLEMAEAWSKDRLAPMLRDTPALSDRVVADNGLRRPDNTIRHKVFPGGHITMAGANSPAGLASRPIRIVLCDEVDRYPSSAGTEGDPIRLAAKRSTTFWNRKLILTSTPTIAGLSRIDTAYQASDRRRYWVPCEDCGESQVLSWSQVQWPENEPDAAVYVCEHCGSVWGDVKRWRAIRKGEWRAERECTGVAGFWLNEIYSPWVPLRDMAANFLDAKRSPETLQTFVNTSLAEVWEEQGDGVDDLSLMSRREPYDAEPVPEQVQLLVAGVDVQDDRLELEVLGFGEGEETWSVDYRVLRGDPSAPDLWRQLEDVLFREWAVQDGPALRISAACIDSGGHHTQAVYNFARKHAQRRIWAIKGMAGARPIFGRPSKNNTGRINLYPVGVDTAKDTVYRRLGIESVGPGYCHFPTRYDEEYFRQLAGETKHTVYKKGRAMSEWRQTRRRVEALDCRVYAWAAFVGLNPDLAQIAKRRARRPAPKPDPETSGGEDVSMSEQSRQVRRNRRMKPRRQGGFVKNY